MAELPDDWVSAPGTEGDALRRALERAVETLDYQDLGACLSDPDDGAIGQWIVEQLDVPGISGVDLRSREDQGVFVDPKSTRNAWRRFHLQAAHWLPNVPQGHKCKRLHGHGFAVILHGRSDASRDVLMHDALADHWRPIGQRLDRRRLNDVPGLENPTSEHLAAWIWRELKPDLPELSLVSVLETVTAGSRFDGRHFGIWKEMSFDSAVARRRVPTDDPNAGVHGHTFTTRLHLNGSLDEVLGWVADFGDVKESFRPLFEQLDHSALHEIPALGDTDPASVARWIYSELSPSLPALISVDVDETPGNGARFERQRDATPLWVHP